MIVLLKINSEKQLFELQSFFDVNIQNLNKTQTTVSDLHSIINLVKSLKDVRYNEMKNNYKKLESTFKILENFCDYKNGKAQLESLRPRFSELQEKVSEKEKSITSDKVRMKIELQRRLVNYRHEISVLESAVEDILVTNTTIEVAARNVDTLIKSIEEMVTSLLRI